MSNLVVSRFSESTLQGNKRFRERTGLGCLYGTPLTMNHFNVGEPVFVVEMNLAANRVEGVGLVLNLVKTGPQYDMYDDYNHNRYIYCGKYRLDRTDMETLEVSGTSVAAADQTPPPTQPLVLDILDRALFKGKSHMKRGVYLSRITDKLLFRWGTISSKKIQDSIYKLFVDKFGISIEMEEELNYELYGL